MIFEIGNYRLDVDVNRTRTYYDAASSISCDCPGCRNFLAAIHLIPKDVHHFFHQLGVSIEKAPDMTAYHSADGMRTYYNGWYHICGTILEGRDPWIKTGETSYQLDPTCKVPLTDGLSVFFSSHVNLLDPAFPQPAFTVEFEGNIPWVLDEPNSYHYTSE